MTVTTTVTGAERVQNHMSEKAGPTRSLDRLEALTRLVLKMPKERLDQIGEADSG